MESDYLLELTYRYFSRNAELISNDLYVYIFYYIPTLKNCQPPIFKQIKLKSSSILIPTEIE